MSNPLRPIDDVTPLSPLDMKLAEKALSLIITYPAMWKDFSQSEHWLNKQGLVELLSRIQTGQFNDMDLRYYRRSVESLLRWNKKTHLFDLIVKDTMQKIPCVLCGSI